MFLRGQVNDGIVACTDGAGPTEEADQIGRSKSRGKGFPLLRHAPARA